MIERLSASQMTREQRSRFWSARRWRLAAFVLNLTQRLQARGFSPSSLILRMTREEIGSYLGLKLETVSRTFSKFQDDGLLDVKRRQIRILDQAGRRQLVNSSAGC